MADPLKPIDPEDFVSPLENYDPKTYDDPIERALAEEKVISIQHAPYATVAPSCSVGEALQKLTEHHVSCLLVEDNGELVGVFSDRDVLNRVALEFDQVTDKTVGDLMTTDPVFVYESDRSAAALSVMAVSGFRHVPITDLQQKVIGIVSPQRVTAFLRKHVEAQ